MKNIFVVIFLFIFSLNLFSQTATPPLGSGTELAPYQITNLENLYWIAASDAVVPSPTQVTRWTAYYEQNADIDASGTSSWFSGAGWSPIGNSSIKFQGTYNGNYHTIDGLFINRNSSDDIGLFGYLSYYAIIRNLGVTNVNITGNNNVAALIGRTLLTGTTNRPYIQSCYSSGTVVGNQYVGGLIGHSNRGLIFKSYSECDVSGNYYIGGLAGTAEYYSSIEESYFTGTVNGYEAVGGLTGYTNFYINILNCYSTGDVTGTNRVGGLIGYLDSPWETNVWDCYSTGFVTGTTNVGGIIGGGTDDTNTCFWDTQTSGQSNSVGGDSKTTAQLKTQSTYITWDFTNKWWMVDGETRPFLRTEWNTTIRNSHQLQMMQMDLTEDYVLRNNIDLSDIIVLKQMWGSSSSSGSGFVPIGNAGANFTGSLDGNGYTIDGLFIARESEYVGLFGYTSHAIIENIGVTNVNITGGTHTAGLVGYNYDNSTINNCYSIGTVSGYLYVGGLVGRNDGGSTISESYSSGIVGSSSNYVGGLAGGNKGSTVSNSYSTANVSTSGIYVGGLVGYHTSSATVNYSYSIGNVSGSNHIGGLIGYNTSSTVNNSFWDTETSLLGSSSGGTGKTIAEMKDIATFTNTSTVGLDSPWDFKGLGAEGIWNLGNSHNDGYPYFDWQYPSDPTTLPVVLSIFTAQHIEDTPILYWETQSETDNMGWFVYRSMENVFSTADEVSELIEGNGTTTEPHFYIYEDTSEDISSGDIYYYWLESIDYCGVVNHYENVAILTIPEGEDPGNQSNIIPEHYGLLQNSPNPFIGITDISFNLIEISQVELVVYNLKGERINNIYSGSSACEEISWDGKDDKGHDLSSGIYLYSLIVNGKTSETKKLILMK